MNYSNLESVEQLQGNLYNLTENLEHINEYDDMKNLYNVLLENLINKKDTNNYNKMFKLTEWVSSQLSRIGKGTDQFDVLNTNWHLKFFDDFDCSIIAYMFFNKICSWLDKSNGFFVKIDSYYYLVYGNEINDLVDWSSIRRNYGVYEEEIKSIKNEYINEKFMEDILEELSA